MGINPLKVETRVQIPLGPKTHLQINSNSGVDKSNNSWYNKGMTKDRKRHIDVHRICPKCGNKDDVLVIAGMGLNFYSCPICSPKQKAPEKEPELSLEE